MSLERCPHKVVLAGHTYQCSLDRGHDGRHRARVDHDRYIGDDLIERGAEIVWPNGEE